jgi:HK97 family phage prohead protease
MTAQERRAAAQLRRQAAEQAGERGGDAAYRSYRSIAPGIGHARRVPMKTEIRAQLVERQGKELVHTEGYFTRYGIDYPMWDEIGQYEESVASGAGAATIASKPDVAFLVNHSGVTMARTTAGTLFLSEKPEGGWHEAFLNPKRTDVNDLIIAMDDKSVDQMSFAFMIPENGGWWSDDFTHFEIRSYDLDRGDVSAVNYGASPYTDIAARTSEVLQDLSHLPMGALREAEDRLIKRGLTRSSGMPAVKAFERDHVEVRSVRSEPVIIAKGSQSKAVARLHAQLAHTSGRIVALAAERGMPQVAELLTAKLPWFEIRNADGAASGEGAPAGEKGGWASIYIYDDIGGSFGVDANSFEAELSEITAPNIALRINSPGGSVFEGITIHSALLHHPAKVRSYIDGLAASAASVVAMAADPYDDATDTGGIVVMPGGQLMIHDASCDGAGNAADKRAEATYLDRQSQNLAAMYAGRAGGDPQEWRDLMLAETWAIGQEAVDLKLADKLYERKVAPADPALAERMKRTFDVSGRYRFNGRRAAPDPMQTRDRIRQQTRSGAFTVPGEVHISREAVDRYGAETLEALNGGPSAIVVHDGDRHDEPKGRSIALVAAQLAAAEQEA